MLSLLLALQAAPAAAPATAPEPEIVVTARHDKCFVELGQHPVSDEQLEKYSESWALGTPVRVIEPRGASLMCEFKIMQSLAAHGNHVAQFVKRSEDLSAEDEAAEKAEDEAEEKRQAAQAAAHPALPPPALEMGQPATAMSSSAPAHAIRQAAPIQFLPPGRADIVPLSCTMADPVRPYQLDLIVNEAKGTVTPQRLDTGSGAEVKAAFLPDVIRFGAFTINRSTLHLWHRNGPMGNESSVSEGQCAPVDTGRVY